MFVSIMQNIKNNISQISKMADKKEMLLRLPENIFEVMKDYKKLSGMSYTNILYNSIVWWLAKQGLLDLDWIREKHAKNGNNGNKKKEEVLIDIMDESLKFCDGASCDFNPSLMENH